MNYDQIVAAMKRSTDPAEMDRLNRCCQERRTEVRARLDAIAQVPGQEMPRALRDAYIKGMDAVAELEHETESLRREHGAMDTLEMLLVEKQKTLVAAQTRAAAPAAIKRLPEARRRVEKALEVLDAAIGELAAVVKPISEVAGMEGEPFPLTDDQAAELLELRDRVFERRDVPVLIPTDPSQFPRSYWLFNETVLVYGEPTVIRRRAPSRDRPPMDGVGPLP